MITSPDENETAMTSPPTVPPQAPPARRTVWPIVLGAIALISGGLSIPMIFRDVAATLGPAGASTAGSSGDMRAINLTIRMGLAIWLVWGSFDLVRRRAVAKKSLQSWATIKVILLGITVIQVIANSLGALPQAGPGQGWTHNGFAAAGMIVWVSMILPIFLLAWFNREKIKEEVAGWP